MVRCYKSSFPEITNVHSRTAYCYWKKAGFAEEKERTSFTKSYRTAWESHLGGMHEYPLGFREKNSKSIQGTLTAKKTVDADLGCYYYWAGNGASNTKSLALLEMCIDHKSLQRRSTWRHFKTFTRIKLIN